LQKNNNLYYLHLDATGSVIRQKSRIYLYMGVVAINEKHVPAFPVFQWLSENHDQQSIKDSLTCWIDKNSEINRKPDIVVTDQSWALLHGVSKAFNNMSLKAQISAQWRIMIGSSEAITILRLCANHYMHTIARRLRNMQLTTKVVKYCLLFIIIIIIIVFLLAKANIQTINGQNDCLYFF